MLSLMGWLQSLMVKFLGKIISVNIIRDIKESYLVPKNPMLLSVGVSGFNLIILERSRIIVNNNDGF